MTDRLLPHSPPDEQGLLGCIMESPSTALPECIETLTDELEIFYDLRHQEIYRCFQIMAEQRTPIDLITLRSHMMSRGLLEQIGGVVYLQEIQDSILSVGNLPAYMATVKEKFILRKMIRVCTDAACRLYNAEGGSSESIIDGVEQEVLAVRAKLQTKSYVRAKELVKGAIGRIEDAHQRQGKIMGLSTGLADFDAMTGGLKGGKLYVVAGLTSQGKSALSLNIAEHIAMQNIPVGVFSLEMTNDELVDRSLCTIARVNSRNISNGYLAERDFPKLTNAAGKLNKAPLFLDDSSGLSIDQLRAKMRRLKQKEGIKFFLVDYIQLLKAFKNGRRMESRQQELAEISMGLKEIAKELDTPVMTLSQIDRKVMKEQRKPTLADLRESGDIAQNSDLVAILHRIINEDEPTPEEQGIPTNLNIEKHRGGPTGTVHLVFFPQYTKFEMAAKIDHSDVPNNLPYND